MSPSFSQRVHQARRLAADVRADALLVTHAANVFYLCGFSGSAGALLIQAGRATLFTDGRYTIQAAQESRGARVRIARGNLLVAVGEFLCKGKGARVAFEPDALTVEQKSQLDGAAGSRIRWRPLRTGVGELRAVKSAEEIAQMRRAARLGSEVFDEVLPLVRPGVRELELAAEIEYRMRRKGAAGPAFSTIVASGARSALPHALPTEKRLRRNELVVLDLGAILGHYCCDLTRTVHIGRAAPAIRQWHRAVREAQDAARESLRAGVAASEVDAAARRILKRFRLEKYFVHSTGHGLGLEVHEDPRIARGQGRRIQPGNVVTLEPGVYVEGLGGIRIEDDFAVSDRGVETLTTASREWIEL